MKSKSKVPQYPRPPELQLIANSKNRQKTEAEAKHGIKVDKKVESIRRINSESKHRISVKRKKKSRRNRFAEVVGIKRSYLGLLGGVSKHIIRVVSVILGTLLTFYIMVYMGEHYLSFLKDWSIATAAFALLFLSIHHISDAVYSADVRIAEGVYSNLATWLQPEEALYVTREILSALDRDDYTVTTRIARLYAERVLLPEMLPSLKEELKKEVLEELKLELTVIPQPEERQKIAVSTTGGQVEGANTHENVKAIRMIARCPEHGPLKPTEVFREDGRLYCVYCGREVK